VAPVVAVEPDGDVATDADLPADCCCIHHQ
jgi:hypothetical protein